MLNEILLPRIARQGTVCLISTRGQARKARIEKSELETLGETTVHNPGDLVKAAALAVSPGFPGCLP